MIAWPLWAVSGQIVWRFGLFLSTYYMLSPFNGRFTFFTLGVIVWSNSRKHILARRIGWDFENLLFPVPSLTQHRKLLQLSTGLLLPLDLKRMVELLSWSLLMQVEVGKALRLVYLRSWVRTRPSPTNVSVFLDLQLAIWVFFLVPGFNVFCIHEQYHNTNLEAQVVLWRPVRLAWGCPCYR
jgi:hypothetical protein